MVKEALLRKKLDYWEKYVRLLVRILTACLLLQALLKIVSQLPKLKQR
jgi:hypothetical protein